ncbi:MAG TPA: ethanolamine ammonia-lyase subunit EutC [Bryobacteraceae bacterium]|jgi:ethanolamine ammonia-lyase small subunit|nr:ethanolamine ammonia-lyase subunit EutC [Bryobacteraceae bacterium]
MSQAVDLVRLRDFTPARVALGRAGHSLPTRHLLDFQAAHARARDAVHAHLHSQALSMELQAIAGECLLANSAAPDRSVYLKRPDLGRILREESRRSLSALAGEFDVVFIVADGLSALAVERHAGPMLQAILALLDPRDWKRSPSVIVQQARVAIGDDVAQCLGASLSVVLIGERPGLSSPDSLGIYLTWNPRLGLTDADRNCVSNIRAEGLSYSAAAQTLLFLMTESRRRKLSGVSLKAAASTLPQTPDR